MHFCPSQISWSDRELATVGAIAAMPGLEPQLEPHLKISMNVGLTLQQLQQVANELRTAGQPNGADRILVAFEKIIS
nr:carboxymuconolactone decarboxylase family protein [Pseudomonas helmanticensis]